MIRWLAMLAALVLLAPASLRLYGETRYVLRGAEPIASTLAAGDHTPAGVVFVFQPEDCLGDGELLKAFNAVQQAGDIPVMGRVVGDGTLSERQQRLFERLNVTLPVRGISRVDAATVAEKLGHEKTPFAVVLDSQGRVAASFPGQQRMPAETLRRLVDRP